MTRARYDDARLRPPRLGDPLVALRNLILALFVLAILGIAFLRFIPDSENRTLRAIGDWTTMVWTTILGLIALLWPILLVLPFRRTNAFYLRAFASEAATGELRLALQQELGSAFRLSGIRDPRRRSSLFLRSLTVFVFCFRYSTVRHMNLEAGDDWLPRLRRSLDDARCAFIDVSDLTSNVLAELHLAHQRMGVSRLMFLSRAGTTVDATRAAVCEALGLDASDAQHVHVGIWDAAPGPARDAFRDAVRRFVAHLPAGSPPLVDEVIPWTPESRIRRAWLALTEIAGLAFIPACLTLYQFGFWSTVSFGGPGERAPSPRLRLYVNTLVPVFHWLVVGMFVYVCYAGAQYFRQCGTRGGRVRSAVILAYYAVLMWLAVVSD